MVDFKAKQKHRNKINKMVEERKKSTAEDEETARAEVMKELRQARKNNRLEKHKQAAKIKADIEASMEGSDKKVVEKAVRKAVAKHFSQLKKAKKPIQQLKARAESMILGLHSQLWCPSDKVWWDDECQERFEDIQLLAAIVSINLLKDPQNFAKMFPAECKKYFDFLAKKRFNAADPEALKPSEGQNNKAPKSGLQKRFEEKKAAMGDVKTSDKEVLESIVTELSEAEKKKALANIKKEWKPVHKPWFDQDCSDSFSKLSDLASSQNLDLSSKVGDFKKFRVKNKEICKAHFVLLNERRNAFNNKQAEKEERKRDAELKKKEKEDAASIPDGFAKGLNKKLTFSDIDTVQNDEDVEKAIKKIDNKLKTNEKKEKKKNKKEAAQKLTAGDNPEKKELDPKKLKKIQKEKERRKRKKEAEASAVNSSEPVNNTVEFQDEVKDETPNKDKKAKKKKLAK